MLGVDHPRHRLIRDQRLQALRPIPGLLLHLPQSSGHRILADLDQPTGKLPPPPIEHEPMPPHQQDTILLIQDDSDRGPIQVDHVMLEPLPAWDLHIRQPQPNPPIVIDQPLPVHDPARQLSVISHSAKLSSRGSSVHMFQTETAAGRALRSPT
ncbi:hypothetical protein GCM10023334_041710 [Nonomuraea thailandensis]